MDHNVFDFRKLSFYQKLMPRHPMTQPGCQFYGSQLCYKKKDFQGDSKLNHPCMPTWSQALTTWRAATGASSTMPGSISHWVRLWTFVGSRINFKCTIFARLGERRRIVVTIIVWRCKGRRFKYYCWRVDFFIIYLFGLLLYIEYIVEPH